MINEQLHQVAVLVCKSVNGFATVIQLYIYANALQFLPKLIIQTKVREIPHQFEWKRVTNEKSIVVL